VNCSEIRKKIENLEFLDDDKFVMQHIEKCDLCRYLYKESILYHELGEMHIPEPHDGFAEKAIRTAVKRNRVKRISSFIGLSATAMLMIVLGTFFMREDPVNHHSSVADSGITHIVDRERTVRVVIKALEPRPNATLAIDLSDNIRLKKYPSRQQLTWQTQLTRGNNLLELPLVFRNDFDGYVSIRYQYNGKEQEIRFRVRANKKEKIRSITST